jgi:hypothetical protein
VIFFLPEVLVKVPEATMYYVLYPGAILMILLGFAIVSA